MLLRAPFFKENFFRDQPYPSLILIAPNCKRRCLGCHNDHLRRREVKDFTLDFLANKITNNPFVVGITLGGLEPADSGDSWWEEIDELIRLAGIRYVTVYTSRAKPFHEFKCENVYWKTGKYDRHYPPIEITIEQTQIKLGSNNQNFFKIGEEHGKR